MTPREKETDTCTNTESTRKSISNDYKQSFCSTKYEKNLKTPILQRTEQNRNRVKSRVQIISNNISTMTAWKLPIYQN